VSDPAGNALSAGPAYVEVAVDVAVPGTDRPFHYRVARELLDRCVPGARVVVPFGRRRVQAVVLRFVATPDVEDVKPVEHVLEEVPPLPPDLLELAPWVARHYACTLPQVFRAITPGVGRGRRGVRARRAADLEPLVPPDVLTAAAERLRARAPRQAAVLEVLAELTAAADSPLPEQAVLARAGPGARPAIAALETRGLVRRRQREVLRDPYAGRSFSHPPPAVLTAAQAEAVRAVSQALESGVHRAFLLQGVTASGKTEVYLQSITRCLARGRGAICLVPEIALTPQMVARFKSRFGGEVAVLHSRLGMGERWDEWRRAQAGHARVVVGARSAVFAPVPRLGLVVLDEEQEASYKQEEDPKYHAREVALHRARLSEAVVVLGSATPAVETAYRAQQGEFCRLELRERVDGRPMPAVRLVDMRAELAAGHRHIFSRDLKAALADRLDRGEQALLFLNRRGFATFVLCRDCGHGLRCRRCSVGLTYHQPRDEVACHYCDARARAPRVCPRCGSHRIRYFGLGTQRVEAELGALFPGVRVVRMDADTTGRKGAHEAILRAFEDRQAQVLVGTQMVARGLDLPGITLVGVVAADTALYLPDFRAAERTFQLLVQVAGRAGRGEDPGEVIVQTYAPDHYSVQMALAHDYAGFLRHELVERRQAGYPPFVTMANFLCAAPRTETARRAAAILAARLAGAIRDAGAEVLGPAPAPLERLKGRSRWQVLLKGPDAAVRQIAREVQVHYNTKGWAGLGGRDGAPTDVRLSVDVDPQNLL